MSYIYKHGLPGIGVTGQQGKQGKSGNSIYFGTFDSFFKYIDTSTLSSIDYDDKDYDITYAKDEYRLDPKYNEGDLLYILNSSLKDSSIDCVIEITEDLTTCTSTQLANNIKYENPFTVNKSKFNRLNIVGSRNNKDHSIKHGMFMANELYNNYPINVTYVVDSINSKPVKVEDLNDPSIDVADEPFIIPKRYLNTEETHLYLNNGREINKYTQKFNTNKGEVLLNLNSSSHLLEIQSYLNSNMSIYIDNTNISDPLDPLGPSDASRNLYIDNLYVRNNNKGNIEALNTLYNNELVLNSYGNCYTLTEDNYDSSTQSFTMNIDDFFNNIDVSKDDYVYGYIHMYYNYNDMNNKNSGVRTRYYSNYIKGTFTDTSLSKVRVPKTDNNGNYIRDYNNESYKNITSSEIKQVLINTWDTSTLENVRSLLPKTVNEAIFNIYKDVRGIIQTEEVEQYKVYDKVIDVSSGYYYKKYHIDSSIFIYDGSNNLQANAKFNDYFDTSYYSGIDTKQFDYSDSSVLKISLDKSDNDSQKYRHHIIQQYIGNKYGIKYFSKLTYADFNYQTSEFDIDSSFIQVNHKDLNKTLNYEDVFNITIDGNIMTLEFKDKLTELYNLCVYENSSKKDITVNKDTGICQVKNIKQSTQDIEKDVITKIPGDKFLKYVYDASVISIPNTEVLYTIKYNTIEDDTAVDETNSTDKIVYSNTVTYNRIIKGYTEKRTIPNIKMNIYNDLESLENINNSSNGILCNQFQTFMTLEIDKFSNDDWGLYKVYLQNPTLRIYINKNISDKPSLTADDNTIKEWIFKYTLYKPGIDIYNISANELDNQNITKELQSDTDGDFYEFTIDEAMSGIWYLRIYMESQNPEPYTFNLQYTIDKIKIVTSNNKTFKLKAKDINKDNLYESNTLKLSIAPISYIASYSQNISLIQTRYLQHPNAIGVRKWFGSREVTNIAIMPYRYDEISQKKVNNKAYKIPNWNSITFKNRYLQDNIKTLSIFTQNINDINNVLPSKLYKNTWLCEDTDDITENYLRLIFNANIFTPRLLNDQYSFIYNNQRLLASQYSQLNNNSAVYIHQYNDINLRTDSLLKSMMKWNDEYEKSYHYETDNPFRGHIETYGNGYQYLPNSADNNQYNQYMSLKEIKKQNELQFFDLGLNKVKTYDINRPDKRDAYTPPVLFNQLLYQASWCYPYYTTNNEEVQNSKSKQYIKQLDFDNAVTLENGVLDANKMPYNLCYNIYPRMMFNDEEQYNVVLMLRRPSVKKEGQYEFKSKDIQQKFNISQIQSINKYLYPLN